METVSHVISKTLLEKMVVVTTASITDMATTTVTATLVIATDGLEVSATKETQPGVDVVLAMEKVEEMMLWA